MKNADGSNSWKKCGNEKQKTGPGRKKSADSKRRSGPGERLKKRLWSSECHRGFLQAFPLQPGQSQLSVESAGFKHSSPGDKGHGPRLQFVQSKPKSS